MCGPLRSRYVRDAPAHGRLASEQDKKNGHPEYLTRRQERPGRHASRRMTDTVLEAVSCSLTPIASPFRTCQRPPSLAVPSIPPRPPPPQVSPLALSTPRSTTHSSAASCVGGQRAAPLESPAGRGAHIKQSRRGEAPAHASRRGKHDDMVNQQGGAGGISQSH